MPARSTGPAPTPSCTWSTSASSAGKPATLDFAEAAALPLTAITAWEMLFDRLGVARDDGAAQARRCWSSAAAGGVGSILIQLARQLTGLTVIATASRPETARPGCASCGAHHVIDHSQPLAQELKAAGPGRRRATWSRLTQTDQHFAQIVELIAPQGRFGLIDDPAGRIDVVPLKRKAVSLHWELMFTRSLFQTADMQRQHELLNEVAALVDQGTLRTTLGRALRHDQRRQSQAGSRVARKRPCTRQARAGALLAGCAPPEQDRRS